jgi:glycosyl transferase family 22 (putative mannosyltransferase)
MAWKKTLKDPALWAIVVIAAIIHFYALDWGTTNQERSLLVFKDENRIQEMTPVMIKARQQIYGWIDDESFERPSIMRPVEKPLIEHYKATQDLPPEQVQLGMLNGMRSYLLRSTDPDEQQILSSLGNMNPLKGDFDPNEYRYGGSYLYALAFVLGIGMVAGFVKLTPDVSFYFIQPDQLARIFIACRFLGALSNVLTSVLLYHWGKTRWNRSVGIIAALLYASSPLIIIYGHISKPNTYSTFWLVLALYTFDRFIIQRPADQPLNLSWKRYGLVGIIMGFSIGAFVVCGIGLLFAALWFASLKPFSLKKTVNSTMIVVIGSAIGFLLTNPYYLFSIGHVLDVYNEHTGGSGGWGYGIPSMVKLSGVLVYLPFTLGVLAFIGVILGMVRDIQRRQVFVLNILICVTIVAAFMGMARFLIPLIPLLCLSAGYGWQGLLSSISWKPVRIILITLGAFFLIIQSMQTMISLSRDNQHRNQAGDWINQHILAKSEIGLLGEKPIIWRTPPFQFEKYALTILYQSDKEFIRETKPVWIVDQLRSRQTVESKQDSSMAIPEENYEMIHRIDPPMILGFLPAITPGYEFPCQSIVIWKRMD